jgi:phage terminase large subunit-like protein
VTFNAATLRDMPDEMVAKALSTLSKSQIEQLHHEWSFWARPEQLEPAGDWNVWFINALLKALGKHTEGLV